VVYILKSSWYWHLWGQYYQNFEIVIGLSQQPEKKLALNTSMQQIWLQRNCTRRHCIKVAGWV